MRVLLIAGTLPPRHCGVGDYAALLAGALARTDGMTVAVLTQSGAGLGLDSCIEVLPSADRWRFAEFPRLLGEIRKWKPEIVHLHYPSHGFGWHYVPVLMPLACKALGAKVIQTWHEPWRIGATLRVLLQRLGADGLVFVRPNYRKLLPPALRKLALSVKHRTIGSAGALPKSGLTDIEKVRLRQKYLAQRRNLIAFFGFVYPAKGVEQIFEIADPRSDAVVIAGATPDALYCERLKAHAKSCGWTDQVSFTGFLAKSEAADLLASADAVVLPFLGGGGDWNTSIHGALTQGTLVITTSAEPTGDDPVRNIYTARVSDVPEMRKALRALVGRRVDAASRDQWLPIAQSHADFYREILAGAARQ
jgi:glycosyltransferase involved in cell wall biosynthesis